MKTLLLLDYNSILIRGMNVTPYLSHNDRYTGGVYIMLTQLAKYFLVHNPDDVVFGNDWKPYFRKEIYPDYKVKPEPKTEKEKKKKEENFKLLVESKPYCNDMLDRLGIPIISEKGFECDDMFGSIIKTKGHLYDRIVICSNDSDLFQLLRPNVILDRGTKGLYTEKRLLKEWGVTPEEWVEVLSLAGSHNAVKPIYKGMGEKTAIKTLRDPAKLKPIQKKYKEAIALRRKLANLPYTTYRINEKQLHNKNCIKNIAGYLQRNYGFDRNNETLQRFYSKLLSRRDDK